LIFRGVYSSPTEVFEVYKTARLELEELFSQDDCDSEVVRTAALLVWAKAFPLLERLMISTKKRSKDASVLFGSDAQTEDIIKTDAYLIFRRKYADAQQAYNAYRAALA
jgi:hypothetical protein